MSVLSVSGLTKRFGSLTAVRDVSFSVDEGEMFGLIGPDGAGKTTLIRLLASLYVPDAGWGTVAGYRLREEYREVRRNIGYMPERFSLYPDLTVEENLAFSASLFGVSVRESKAFIAPVYSQIEPFASRRAGKLSGGMKQKLALSCALIHRPRLLLLDEPTRGVDPVARSEFWQLLAQLRKQDIAIVVATSYMDEATLCSRVALCHGGSFLKQDTPDALRASFGEPLYKLDASPRYRALLAARRQPDVARCYAFGDVTHLVFRHPEVDLDAFSRHLEYEGCMVRGLTPVQATIEDCFMQQTSGDYGTEPH